MRLKVKRNKRYMFITGLSKRCSGKLLNYASNKIFQSLALTLFLLTLKPCLKTICKILRNIFKLVNPIVFYIVIYFTHSIIGFFHNVFWYPTLFLNKLTKYCSKHKNYVKEKINALSFIRTCNLFDY